MANVTIVYPLKTPGKHWFYGVFTGYKMGALAENELTHFSPMFHFCIPWKRQKTEGFLTFSGGIEMEHWAKTG